MDVPSLISWIESEGYFIIICRPRYSQYKLVAGICQKDVDVLKRIQSELGFGSIYDYSSKKGNVPHLVWNTMKDRDKLILLLDSVDESKWYTKKLNKYKVWKEAHKFLKSKYNKHWNPETVSIFIEYRDQVSNSLFDREHLLNEFNINRTKWKNSAKQRKSSVIDYM